MYDARPAGGLRLLAVALTTVAGLLASGSPATARAEADPVSSWAGRHATPITSLDVDAPLADLTPLLRSVGDASIVGLGESVHGSSEELSLKFRVARLLVEQKGFRSIAWEEDWTTGLEVDRYLQGGPEDVDTLLGRMGAQWQTREVRDGLTWLRRFNLAHHRRVRFVGVEFYATPRRAYDRLAAYVAHTAPHLVPEADRHLAAIRPTADIYEYIQSLESVPDKSPLINHAKALERLVRSLGSRDRSERQSIAERTARQIVSFYEHYALPESLRPTYRDARVAQNIRWLRTHDGKKVAYWAASPHVANAPDLRITRSSEPDLRFASAGSHLRRWFGERYVPMGFTIGRGSVSLGYGDPLELPAPPASWFEHPLTAVDKEQFSLDLRSRPTTAAVRSWLIRPATTRGLPGEGSESSTSGGSLAEWFDVVIHRQVSTAARPF